VQTGAWNWCSIACFPRNRDIGARKERIAFFGGCGMIKDKVVLLVDDEPSILNATKVGLADRGFTVKAVDGAEAALKALHSLKPSIIVSDLVMPGTNGFELFQQVRKAAGFRSRAWKRGVRHKTGRP
jgi:PleD family two-component response regulator